MHDLQKYAEICLEEVNSIGLVSLKNAVLRLKKMYNPNKLERYAVTREKKGE